MNTNMTIQLFGKTAGQVQYVIGFDELVCEGAGIGGYLSHDHIQQHADVVSLSKFGEELLGYEKTTRGCTLLYSRYGLWVTIAKSFDDEAVLYKLVQTASMATNGNDVKVTFLDEESNELGEIVFPGKTIFSVFTRQLAMN